MCFGLETSKEVKTSYAPNPQVAAGATTGLNVGQKMLSGPTNTTFGQQYGGDLTLSLIHI